MENHKPEVAWMEQSGVVPGAYGAHVIGFNPARSSANSSGESNSKRSRRRCAVPDWTGC
jgi:hypothetical protein